MTVDVNDLGIREAIGLMQRGELTSVDLTQACLDRIDALDDRINAFITVTPDLAMEGARAADRTLTPDAPLPLHGIPIALKDNIALAGVPMTAGSPFLGDCIPGEDAPIVTRVRRAGAVILGKLNMHEWAIGATSQNPHFGSVRNPWDLSRIAGGSSGGSAAAVAAGMALAALGSDTGGSGRIPAALTGISGLRPTTGRVPTDGVVPMSWTFDSISPMARRADDVSLLLHLLAGDAESDATTAGLEVKKEDVRIGLLVGSVASETDPRVWSAFRGAVDVLATMGARIQEISLDVLDAAGTALRPQMLADAAAYHGDRLAESPELFGPDVLERLRIGAAVTGPEYALARESTRAWKRDLARMFESVDVLVLPTCPVIAPTAQETDGVATTAILTRLTYPWSLAGVPALSIPCGIVEGLPVGMQIVGPWGSEASVLRAARRFQEITPWHERHSRTAVELS